MRAVHVLVLACALGGCQTVRGVFGEVQRAGDQGITVGGAAATEATAAQTAVPARPELPGGLTGDKANRAYSTDVPRS